MSVKGFASGKHHTHVNVYFVSRIDQFNLGITESKENPLSFLPPYES